MVSLARFVLCSTAISSRAAAQRDILVLRPCLKAKVAGLTFVSVLIKILLFDLLILKVIILKCLLGFFVFGVTGVGLENLQDFALVHVIVVVGAVN